MIAWQALQVVIILLLLIRYSIKCAIFHFLAIANCDRATQMLLI
ncbi:MAG: hypothetical protein V7K57_05570 [Nostoc sp.]